MDFQVPVFISRGHSRNPEKRGLEQALADALADHPQIRVSVINNLYDLRPDGPAIQALRAVEGDMILLSWHYPRSSHWVLDRCGVRGQVGETQLVDDAEDGSDDAETVEDPTHRVLDNRTLPSRSIYCLDLRVDERAEPYLDEVRRIVEVVRRRALEAWVGGSPRTEQLARYLADSDGSGRLPEQVDATPGSGPSRIDEDTSRRWYPVIDFSRCTNCLECIDFCLFGVYGIDNAETILVEQPDNCRKGCPACSRVCPENAIIFPQHKAPAIAGAKVDSSGLKIDLSRLFGAPEAGQEAVDVAVRERDEQLLLAGQKPVGDTVGVTPPRRKHDPGRPKDELDQLLDELESCDL